MPSCEQVREPTMSDAPADIPPETLKKALRAFKKRLKLARLDDESTLGGRQTTAGRRSGITAVRAPNQFPKEVWDALVEAGKLAYVGSGLYELVDPGSPQR